MGGLALAGAISGMGQGLERGVLNLQQGLIQSGLQQERDKMEQERLNLTFAHQDAQEQRGYAQQSAIEQQREGSQTVRDTLKEQSDERRHGETLKSHAEDRASHAELENKARTERSENKAAELEQKDEERRIQEEHYKREDDFRKTYYEALAHIRDGKGTAADSKALNDYGEIIKARIAGLNHQAEEITKNDLLDATTKKTYLKDINKQIAGLDDDFRGLAKFPARAQVPSGGAQIESPFPLPGAKPAPAKAGSAQAAEPPAAPAPPVAPGTLNQPGGYYPGKELFDDFGRRILPSSKYPSGPPTVPNQQ